ncbi:division/cell wall cluster transcriptional repressor MraZ [Alphaproteobacteria bacterium]|jgi:MraZ protein|nr:division/cell wall cluster transcriptional repressor MraZ [Alphaproteobacteria bacterium]
MISHSIPLMLNQAIRGKITLGRHEVDLFLSTFENKLDRKGRLSVPARYRAVFERNGTPLYLYKSLTQSCLEGCGTERISQIVDAIDEMDVLSEDTLTLQTMLSSAQEMKLDNEGRVMLSDDFIDYAGLSDSALFVGIGRSFQIWDPEQWRPLEQDARNNAKNGKMPKLTLTRSTNRGDV